MRVMSAEWRFGVPAVHKKRGGSEENRTVWDRKKVASVRKTVRPVGTSYYHEQPSTYIKPKKGGQRK